MVNKIKRAIQFWLYKHHRKLPKPLNYYCRFPTVAILDQCWLNKDLTDPSRISGSSELAAYTYYWNLKSPYRDDIYCFELIKSTTKASTTHHVLLLLDNFIEKYYNML